MKSTTANVDIAARQNVADQGTELPLAYAGYALFVLMVCYTLSFIDRQALVLLVPQIKRDLGLTDVRVSLLQGLAFALFYTTLGIPMGRIADTKNRRMLIVVGVVFWSFMTVVCAAAKDFSSLFLARMGVGIGEASLAPAAFSLVTDYFSRERLGRALSVYSMGIFIGSGLAFIVGGSVVQATTRLAAVDVPLLGVIQSWRLTFLIVGVPGLLVALWTATLREPARRNLLRDESGRVPVPTVRTVLQQIGLRWQSVFGISLAMVFQSMCTYGFTAWAPAYFQRVYRFSAGEVSLILGLLIVSFGCLGMYLGGVFTDHWRKRGIVEAPMRVGAVGAVGAGALFGTAFAFSNPAVTLAIFAPALIFLGLPMGISYAALQWILPNQVRGQVSALFLMILNLGGITLGPLLPALISDRVFKSEQMIGTGLAISIVIAALGQMVTFWLVSPKYRQHSLTMNQLVRSAV